MSEPCTVCDSWYQRALAAEAERDAAVELLRRRDALMKDEAVMATNGFDGIETHDDALRDWDEDLVTFLATATSARLDEDRLYDQAVADAALHELTDECPG